MTDNSKLVPTLDDTLRNLKEALEFIDGVIAALALTEHASVTDLADAYLAAEAALACYRAAEAQEAVESRGALHERVRAAEGAMMVAIAALRHCTDPKASPAMSRTGLADQLAVAVSDALDAITVLQGRCDEGEFPTSDDLPRYRTEAEAQRKRADQLAVDLAAAVSRAAWLETVLAAEREPKQADGYSGLQAGTTISLRDRAFLYKSLSDRTLVGEVVNTLTGVVRDIHTDDAGCWVLFSPTTKGGGRREDAVVNFADILGVRVPNPKASPPDGARVDIRYGAKLYLGPDYQKHIGVAGAGLSGVVDSTYPIDGKQWVKVFTDAPSPHSVGLGFVVVRADDVVEALDTPRRGAAKPMAEDVPNDDQDEDVCCDVGRRVSIKKGACLRERFGSTVTDGQPSRVALTGVVVARFGPYNPSFGPYNPNWIQVKLDDGQVHTGTTCVHASDITDNHKG